MYSLAARVMEVDEEKKIAKVKFRCTNIVEAKFHSDKKIMVGDYVSIIGAKDEHEICGDKITPASEW